MPKVTETYIRIRLEPEVRNHLLGKLRARGTTMQGFFEDIAILAKRDDVFLTFLEAKRDELKEKCEVAS